MKISRSRSSSTSSSSRLGAIRASASSRSAISPSDASKRARRRIASIALKRPAETSHARGFAGTPSRGHCSTRRGEGVVQRLLGEVEVAEQADQRGEDAARLGAVDRIDRARGRLRPRRRIGSVWRSVVVSPDLHDRPHLDAARCAPRGIRAATWIASFRSRASIRKKPPSCSFVSANGPSVVETLPLRTRTVVAVLTGSSACAATR